MVRKYVIPAIFLVLIWTTWTFSYIWDWENAPPSQTINFNSVLRNTLNTWVANFKAIDNEIYAARDGETSLGAKMALKLENVHDDPSPQLAANLDVNGNTITGFTASRALEIDGSGNIQVSTITSTELNYLSGVTSAVQAQIDAKGTGNMSNVVEDETPQLGGDLDSNGHYFVLDPTPDSDDTGSGIVATMVIDSAQSVDIGDCLCTATDGELILSDADAEATKFCEYIALESGTGSKKVLLRGYMRNDGWAWTIGNPLFVSTTSGDLTQTAPSGSGDFVVVAGVATHADRIRFNPSFVWVEVQ